MDGASISVRVRVCVSICLSVCVDVCSCQSEYVHACKRERGRQRKREMGGGGHSRGMEPGMRVPGSALLPVMPIIDRRLNIRWKFLIFSHLRLAALYRLPRVRVPLEKRHV